jgi:hypothetical protein
MRCARLLAYSFLLLEPHAIDPAMSERYVQAVSLFIVNEFSLPCLRVENENALRAHSAFQTFSPIGWGLAHPARIRNGVATAMARPSHMAMMMRFLMSAGLLHVNGLYRTSLAAEWPSHRIRREEGTSNHLSTEDLHLARNAADAAMAIEDVEPVLEALLAFALVNDHSVAHLYLLNRCSSPL